MLIFASGVHCVITGRGLGGWGGIVLIEKFSYSYGVPVLSRVFSRQEASSDRVLRCHTGQRFQTCWPTENPSFCSGEGSAQHTRGQRHHLVILEEDCSKNALNHTYRRYNCMARIMTNKHGPALWQHNKRPSKT